MEYSHAVIDGHYHILVGWHNHAGQNFVQSASDYLESRGLETLNTMTRVKEWPTDRDMFVAVPKIKADSL